MTTPTCAYRAIRSRLADADTRAQTPLRAARSFAAGAAAVAAATFIGWLVDAAPSRAFVAGGAPMAPASGVCIAVLALTWWLPRAGAVAASVAVGTVAGAEASVTGLHGGRMSLFAAISIVLLAVARCSCSASPARRELWSHGRRRTVQTCGLLVLAMLCPALIGFFLQRPALTGIGSSTPISLPGTVALISLALAVQLDVPHGVLTWSVRGQDVGARMLRRLLPPTFAALPCIAFLSLQGQHSGLYGEDAGVAITVTASLLVLGVIACLAAERLVRTDRVRAEAVDTLRAITLDVDALVHARADELAASRHAVELDRDRERIAADLHDLVIQRLYAVSLSLDVPSPSTHTVTGAVESIDAAMRELRGTIFNLHSAAADVSIEQTLTDMRLLCQAAGFDLDLRTDSGLDALPTPIRVHLSAVVRETVSNAVRHSGGSGITLRVVRSHSDLTLLCSDDGHGFDDQRATPSGLRNLRTRAKDLGGQATWAANKPTGTLVTWHVPLTRPREAALALPGTAAMAAAVSQAVASLNLSAHLSLEHRLGEIGELLRSQIDAEAMCVVVTLIDEPDHLGIVRCSGMPEGSVGFRYHRDASLVAPALASGQCLVVEHIATASAAGRSMGRIPDGPALIAPLCIDTASGTTEAAIVLLRSAYRAPFSLDEVARAEVVTQLVTTTVAGAMATAC